MTDPQEQDQGPRRPPKAALEAHAVRDSDKSAGIVSRGAGAVLDLIAVLLILSGLYLGLVMVRLVYDVRHFSMPSPNGFFTAAAFIVVSVAYLASCWAVSGRTFGSVVMGLRVVNRKGVTLRPIIAVVRAVICVLFAVGLLWVVVDRRRRSVADLIFGTHVIYSR